MAVQCIEGEDVLIYCDGPGCNQFFLGDALSIGWIMMLVALPGYPQIVFCSLGCLGEWLHDRTFPT